MAALLRRYVALWIALSAVVILYNKYLLAYGGFPFPIALTMWVLLLQFYTAGVGGDASSGHAG